MPLMLRSIMSLTCSINRRDHHTIAGSNRYGNGLSPYERLSRCNGEGFEGSISPLRGWMPQESVCLQPLLGDGSGLTLFAGPQG